MDIKDIEFSPFASALMKLEKAAEDPAARRRAERYAGCVAFAAFIGVIAVGMPAALLLCAWIGLPSFASLFFMSVAFCAAPAVYLSARYSDETQWRLRTAGPQSRAFLDAHGARRAALMEASGGYNATLGGLMALPSGDDPEAGATLAESMEQRRAALARETDAYLREFEAATAGDRARYAAPPARKRNLNPRKAALRDSAGKSDISRNWRRRSAACSPPPTPASPSTSRLSSPPSATAAISNRNANGSSPGASSLGGCPFRAPRPASSFPPSPDTIASGHFLSLDARPISGWNARVRKGGKDAHCMDSDCARRRRTLVLRYPSAPREVPERRSGRTRR